VCTQSSARTQKPPATSPGLGWKWGGIRRRRHRRRRRRAAAANTTTTATVAATTAAAGVTPPSGSAHLDIVVAWGDAVGARVSDGWPTVSPSGRGGEPAVKTKTNTKAVAGGKGRRSVFQHVSEHLSD
jgi:hypothetical protein